MDVKDVTGVKLRDEVVGNVLLMLHAPHVSVPASYGWAWLPQRAVRTRI